MNMHQRITIYLAQTGRKQVTPRQERRINKKVFKAAARQRLVDYLRELEPDQRELLLGARDNW